MLSTTGLRTRVTNAGNQTLNSNFFREVFCEFDFQYLIYLTEQDFLWNGLNLKRYAFDPNLSNLLNINSLLKKKKDVQHSMGGCGCILQMMT